MEGKFKQAYANNPSLTTHLLAKGEPSTLQASLSKSPNISKGSDISCIQTIMDSAIPPQRRPALIPKDAVLGPDDILSICTRTGHAIIPPPEQSSPQQAPHSHTEFNQAGHDSIKQGTKRKASTSNDRTYESASNNNSV